MLVVGLIDIQHMQSVIKVFFFLQNCYYFSDLEPGGVLRFELDRGVPLEPQNPYPSLRVILAEKGTHF